MRTKVIDGFIFYNELKLLEFRLKYLYDKVDYFIIVEGTKTFTGHSKPLYLKENKTLLKKYGKKIIHIIVDDFPHQGNNRDTTGYEYIYETMALTRQQVWENEHFLRNAIKRGVEKIELNDEDMIIISDVDEIPNRNIINKLIKHPYNYTLDFDFYYYSIEYKKKGIWNKPKAVMHQFFKSSLPELIRHSFLPVSIKEGGWHFSYFGDPEFISNKIKTFSHQEYNHHSHTDTDNIKKRIKKGEDIFQRSGKDLIKVNPSNSNLPTLDNLTPSENIKYLLELSEGV